MHPQLDVQRRVLFRAYQRYLASERALVEAMITALNWLPDLGTPSIELIGNSGSRIRRLYEGRERAMARVRLAQQALEDAERRMKRRGMTHVLLIGVHPASGA